MAAAATSARPGRDPVAEALIAAADNHLDDGDHDLDLDATEAATRAAAGFDLLDVLEAMSGQFHEHHDEILRWSWKLFCAKWVRLIHAMERRRKEDAEREREREFERLKQAHRAHWG